MCDRIMVVEHGRVTALDSPAALTASSDFYRRALATAGIVADEGPRPPGGHAAASGRLTT